MKTLPEVIRDAILLLEGGVRESVVIARGDPEPLDERCSAYQLQLRHVPYLGPLSYRCKARAWLGGEWSSWGEHRSWLGDASFDIRDVLATDWRIS